MERLKRQSPEVSTLLEVVLQLNGELQKTLEPIRVTPLQAGVLLFLSRHAATNLANAAATLRVSSPTMSEVVKDLVRKRWATKRRSVTEYRAVQLELSLQRHTLARHIEERVRQVEVPLSEPDPATLGVHSTGRA